MSFPLPGKHAWYRTSSSPADDRGVTVETFTLEQCFAQYDICHTPVGWDVSSKGGSRSHTLPKGFDIWYQKSLSIPVIVKGRGIVVRDVSVKTFDPKSMVLVLEQCVAQRDVLPTKTMGDMGWTLSSRGGSRSHTLPKGFDVWYEISVSLSDKSENTLPMPVAEVTGPACKYNKAAKPSRPCLHVNRTH